MGETFNLERRGTNEFQPVRGILPDVSHDVTVYHPLRHRGKPMLLHVTENTHKFQDVWMRQRIPKDSLFTELLGDCLSVIQFGWKTPFPAHLSYLFRVVCHREPQRLHRDGTSLVLPRLYIRKAARDGGLMTTRKDDLICNGHRFGQLRVLR